MQIVHAYAQVVPENRHGLYALALAAVPGGRRGGPGTRRLHRFASARRHWVVHRAHADGAAVHLGRRAAAHADASFHRTRHVCNNVI